MCEVVSGDWSADLVEIVGIPVETLPPIVDRQQASYLLPEMSKRWPRFAAAPWFPPLGDGACANVGSGATDRSRIALTLGTTGAMRVLDHSPTGQAVEPYHGLWTYRLDANTVIHGAAITNGGIWFDFVRETLLDTGGELLDEAFALPPCEHGLTVLPFLAGERAPIWNDRARAVIAGLSPGTSRADIARASLEAVAHRLALLYVDTAPAASPDHEIIANGAALLRSDGLQQIVADALGRPLITLPETLEASARGAAICAMHSAGLIDSISDVDDFVLMSPSVSPLGQHLEIYRVERERQEALRRLLYPESSSWDYPQPSPEASQTGDRLTAI
jgi:gluconokinase